MKKNKNNKNSTYVTKQQLKSVLVQLSKKVNKFVDNSITLGAFTTTVDTVAFPTLGATQNLSIGEKFIFDKIEFKFAWRALAIASCLPAVCRITIVQAMEPRASGSAYAVGDIYQSSASPQAIITSPFDYENHNTRFRVIFDRLFEINPFDNATGHIIASIKPPIKDILYDVTNTTYNKGLCNILCTYSVIGGSNWNTAGSGVTANFIVRTWFHDT